MRTVGLVLFGLWWVALVAAGDRARFDHYRVYQVSAKSQAGLAALQEIEGSSDSLMFLSEPYAVDRKINVIVAPHKVPDFVETLSVSDVQFQLVEENVQTSINQMQPLTGGQRSGVYDWKSYRTLEDTYDWMTSLEKEYPGVVSGIVGGRTYEGREIRGVKISYKEGNQGIFLEGGIHAREWIAPATVTYIANQLLTSKDAAVRNIAENNDWYIFPHVNPDGYVYTITTNRMWRKTRSVNAGSTCRGTDPNRNWDSFWAVAGASRNPCSDSYAGPSVFSEIETKSLSEYIASLKLGLYVAFHSYSQLLMYPFGHTSDLPTNHKDLEQIYDAALAALTKRYGTRYTGGNIHDAIYAASGGSIDWVYSSRNVSLSYVYELRPSSNAAWTGFELPANQIIANGEEIVDSIVAMVNESKKLKYLL